MESADCAYIHDLASMISRVIHIYTHTHTHTPILCSISAQAEGALTNPLYSKYFVYITYIHYIRYTSFLNAILFERPNGVIIDSYHHSHIANHHLTLFLTGEIIFASFPVININQSIKNFISDDEKKITCWRFK